MQRGAHGDLPHLSSSLVGTESLNMTSFDTHSVDILTAQQALLGGAHQRSSSALAQSQPAQYPLSPEEQARTPLHVALQRGSMHPLHALATKEEALRIQAKMQAAREANDAETLFRLVAEYANVCAALANQAEAALAQRENEMAQDLAAQWEMTERIGQESSASVESLRERLQAESDARHAAERRAQEAVQERGEAEARLVDSQRTFDELMKDHEHLLQEADTLNEARHVQGDTPGEVAQLKAAVQHEQGVAVQATQEALDLRTQLEQVEGRLKEALQRAHEAETRVRDLADGRGPDASVSFYKAQVQQFQAQLREARAQLVEAQRGNGEVQAECEAAVRSMEKVAASEAALRSECAHIRRQLDVAEADARRLRVELADAQKKGQTAAEARAARELDSLREELAESSVSRDALQARVDELESRVRSLSSAAALHTPQQNSKDQANSSGDAAEINALRRKLQQLQEAFSSAESRAIAAERQLERTVASHASQLATVREASDEKVAATEAALADATGAMDVLKTECDMLRQRASSMLTALAERDQQLAAPHVSPQARGSGAGSPSSASLTFASPRTPGLNAPAASLSPSKASQQAAQAFQALVQIADVALASLQARHASSQRIAAGDFGASVVAIDMFSGATQGLRSRDVNGEATALKWVQAMDDLQGALAQLSSEREDLVRTVALLQTQLAEQRETALRSEVETLRKAVEEVQQLGVAPVAAPTEGTAAGVTAARTDAAIVSSPVHKPVTLDSLFSPQLSGTPSDVLMAQIRAAAEPPTTVRREGSFSLPVGPVGELHRRTGKATDASPLSQTQVNTLKSMRSLAEENAALSDKLLVSHALQCGLETELVRLRTALAAATNEVDALKQQLDAALQEAEADKAKLLELQVSVGQGGSGQGVPRTGTVRTGGVAATAQPGMQKAVAPEHAHTAKSLVRGAARRPTIQNNAAHEERAGVKEEETAVATTLLAAADTTHRVISKITVKPSGELCIVYGESAALGRPPLPLLLDGVPMAGRAGAVAWEDDSKDSEGLDVLATAPAGVNDISGGSYSSTVSHTAELNVSFTGGGGSTSSGGKGASRAQDTLQAKATATYTEESVWHIKVAHQQAVANLASLVAARGLHSAGQPAPLLLSRQGRQDYPATGTSRTVRSLSMAAAPRVKVSATGRRTLYPPADPQAPTTYEQQEHAVGTDHVPARRQRIERATRLDESLAGVEGMPQHVSPQKEWAAQFSKAQQAFIPAAVYEATAAAAAASSRAAAAANAIPIPGGAHHRSQSTPPRPASQSLPGPAPPGLPPSIAAFAREQGMPVELLTKPSMLAAVVQEVHKAMREAQAAGDVVPDRMKEFVAWGSAALSSRSGPVSAPQGAPPLTAMQSASVHAGSNPLSRQPQPTTDPSGAINMFARRPASPARPAVMLQAGGGGGGGAGKPPKPQKHVRQAHRQEAQNAALPAAWMTPVPERPVASSAFLQASSHVGASASSACITPMALGMQELQVTPMHMLQSQAPIYHASGSVAVGPGPGQLDEGDAWVDAVPM